MVASAAMTSSGIATTLFALICLVAQPALAEPSCTEDPERGGGRPTLSGPVQTLDSDDGFFRIHWTEEGMDAPTAQSDGDGNGQADFLDRILDGLTRGRGAFAEQGWREVLPDDGTGGSDAIDVYVKAIDANGYAFHAAKADDADGASSCAVHLEGALGDSLDGILESVAAHELHHCVQYAYTTTAPSWILEATATHQQYQVFTSPALQAALEVLWIGRLTQPERPLHDLGGRYEYAGFVFVFFWESFGGLDRSRPPALWEALAEVDGQDTGGWVDALDAESERLWGQSFSRTFADYSTWNAFACFRDDGAHYDPAMYPCNLDTTVPIEDAPDELVLDLPHVRYSAGYASYPSDGEDRPLELDCQGPGDGGARAQVRLLALDRFFRVGEVVDATARGGDPFTIRLEDPVDVAGSVLVVATSTGLDPVQIDCSAERVEPIADEPPTGGTGCDCVTSGELAVSPVPLLGLAVLSKRRRRR
jgi:hypothetical protein